MQRVVEVWRVIPGIVAQLQVVHTRSVDRQVVRRIGPTPPAVVLAGVDPVLIAEHRAADARYWPGAAHVDTRYDDSNVAIVRVVPVLLFHRRRADAKRVEPDVGRVFESLDVGQDLLDAVRSGGDGVADEADADRVGAQA